MLIPVRTLLCSKMVRTAARILDLSVDLRAPPDVPAGVMPSICYLRAPRRESIAQAVVNTKVPRLTMVSAHKDHQHRTTLGYLPVVRGENSSAFPLIDASGAWASLREIRAQFLKTRNMFLQKARAPCCTAPGDTAGVGHTNKTQPSNVAYCVV